MVDRERIRFLPNPIKVIQRKQQKSRRKIILSVGRLVEQKRFDLLIRAFAESGTSKDGWRLVIVGDGPLHSSLVSLGDSLGLEGSLVLEKANARIWQAYRDASIFSLFSEYEGMPNVLLEAMMYGLFPLVTHGVGDLAHEIREVSSDFVISEPTLLNCADHLRMLVNKWANREEQRRIVSQLVCPYNLERVSADWLSAIAHTYPAKRIN